MNTDYMLNTILEVQRGVDHTILSHWNVSRFENTIKHKNTYLHDYQFMTCRYSIIPYRSIQYTGDCLTKLTARIIALESVTGKVFYTNFCKIEKY